MASAIEKIEAAIEKQGEMIARLVELTAATQVLEGNIANTDRRLTHDVQQLDARMTREFEALSHRIEKVETQMSRAFWSILAAFASIVGSFIYDIIERVR